MAGHWIPWEFGLEKKREVIVIARKLGVSRREAAAMCMEVWVWASDQSIDGLIQGIDAACVSDAVGIEGIGQAMASDECRWIVESDNCIQFPNWQRFNGRSAKSRLLKAEQNKRNYLNKKFIPTEIQ